VKQGNEYLYESGIHSAGMQYMVQEVRTGANAYSVEYTYDATGNRWARAMVKNGRGWWTMLIPADPKQRRNP